METRWTQSRRAALRRWCLVLLAAVFCMPTSPVWPADRLFPGGPLQCEANLESSGGDDASTNVMEMANSIFVRTTNGSSHGEVGFEFRPFISHPATVRMGVTYAGLLVGTSNISDASIEITVTLRNETDGFDIDTVVVLNQSENGNAGGSVFNVVTSDPFNPPVATFSNVNLERNHDYSVILRAVAAADAGISEADFKSGGRFVRYGCIEIETLMLDSDGDGLYDDWEQNGIDVDGDGNIDIDLPGFGAKWDHKDLFVEMDWRPGRQPYQASIRALKTAFALAPKDAGGTPNPDDTDGINLWVDTGSLAVGSEDGAGPGSCTDGMDNGGGDEDGDGNPDFDSGDVDCQGREDGSINLNSCIDGVDNGGGDGADAADPDCLVGDNLGGGGDIVPNPVTCIGPTFYAARDVLFEEARLLAFRYLVSGVSPGENTCANGRAVAGKAELGGNDLVVYGTDPGLIFHELGHTLNLHHGGFEGRNNKPNYISMMNYNYGLSIPQLNSSLGIIDFAPARCANCPGGRAAIPAPLDESALDEMMVLDVNDTENIFQFRDLLAATMNWVASGQDIDGDLAFEIDWDGDNMVAGGFVEVDINEDGKCVSPGDNGTLQTTPAGDDVALSDNIIHDGPNRCCNTAKLGGSDDVQTRAVGACQPNVHDAYDDWANIVLNPREFGDLADAPATTSPEERSLEEYRAQAEESNTTDLEIVKTDAPDPVNADAELVYTLTVTNHGPVPARGVRVTDHLSTRATYVSDNGGCALEPGNTLVCQLPTLLPEEMFELDVTVIYQADDVADLPTPAIVENEAAVENKVPYGLDGNLGEVGGDPNPANNDDSEQTVVNRPPVSDPNGPYVEECTGTTTTVALDGSGSFDPDGDPITYEWTTDCPGGVFDDAAAESPLLTVTSPPPCPVVCSATLTVTDPGNLSDTESTTVTIEDTTPPTITVELVPESLWPPNHKLVEITANVVSADICDPAPTVVLTSITSDEPDNGKGDGNTVNDIQNAAFGTEDLAFSLRAERAGPGAGRTYTVTYTATDDCGNSTSESATVFVPKSKGKPK